MKFCPFCGAKVMHEQAKFCAECGKRFDVISTDTVSEDAAKISELAGQVAEQGKAFISEKAGQVAEQGKTFVSDTFNKFFKKSDTSTEQLNVGQSFSGKSQKSAIEKELSECQKYAEEGYQLAVGKYNDIEKTLVDEKERLKNTAYEQDEISRIQNAEILKEQEEEQKNLANYLSGIKRDINMLHENMKDFSIIIFGRTMAGKSTLMEILTHGNGQSIGKGKQRTTLDVRSYYWQGLKITDVPGICAFGGKEDEQLAIETAKSADLILFLLTDDASQADEATFLAQLKNLGKPVLGVINVKKNFDIFDVDKKKLYIRNLENSLKDNERIDSICEQFKDFAQKHNQDWSDIPFVYTHLKAAFQSQPERGNDKEVYAMSNFPKVEEFILEKVRTDGKFLRVKNFIDIAAVPMQKIIYEINSHSRDAFFKSHIYIDKYNQLYEWRAKFLEKSQKKLDRFYDDLESEIKRELNEFVEYNYENKNAGEDWNNIINNMNLQQRYQKLLEGFAKERNRKLKELSDEFMQELNFTFHGNLKTNVEIEDTTPWGQYAALVLPNLLVFVPGIGWGVRIAIGAGSWLFSNFFEDKEEKIREAKKKMSQELADKTFTVLSDMHNKMVDVYFNDEILGKGVDGFGDILNTMICSLNRLGKDQWELAHNLTVHLSDLNMRLLSEAAKYKNLSIEECESARVPGEQFVIFSDSWKGDTKEISTLLGEKVIISNVNTPINYILNSEIKVIDDVEIDAEDDAKKITVIRCENKVNPTNLALAQQVSSYPIIADKV